MRSLVTTALLALALLLAGCRADIHYRVRIENRTDQPVTVTLLREYTLRPCSVLGYGPVAGPPSSGPVPMEAHTQGGDSLLQGAVQPQRRAGYVTELAVQVSTDGPDVCPAPSGDEGFRLVVQNLTDEPLQVSYGGRALGRVPADDEQFVARLDGPLREVDRVTVCAARDAVDGICSDQAQQRLIRGDILDYDLGRAPTVRLWAMRDAGQALSLPQEE